MSLGLLVGRFGEFLSEHVLPPPEFAAGAPLTDDLMRIRQHYGHHLIVLALLARADGESAPSERAVIVQHCISRAKASGIEMTEPEETALEQHLAEFRPLRGQLDIAVQHMRHDTIEDIAALILAAKDIVDADGIRRPREIEFLEELSRDLASISVDVA